MRERTSEEARIGSLAQARRHHLRQQLTAEEQAEFDEQYGDEEDMLFEQADPEDDLNEDDENLDEEYESGDYGDADHQFHSFRPGQEDEDGPPDDEDEEQMEAYSPGPQ